MVTQSAPNPAPTKPPEHPPDDHSGAFGFFRKYQKAILYSAGLFTLITFSVTGALLGLFERMKHTPGARPTITIDGQQIPVEEEDFSFGRDLAAYHYVPAMVLPAIESGRTESSTDLADAFAILRRAAITEGIDVSDAEVDRAISFVLEATGFPSVAKLALARSTVSAAHYRAVVKEAMRVGNYVRLQSLVADTSDAAVIDELLDGAEKLTLRVATLQLKKLEEELKKGTIVDDDLKKWLEGKDDSWKATAGVYDTNHVALQVGYVLFEQFDASQWTEELKLFNPTADMLKPFYEEVKDREFKIDEKKYLEEHPGATLPIPTHQPIDNDAVQARLKLIASADEVMNGVRKKILDQQNESAKAQVEAMRTAADERNKAQMALDAAKKAVIAAPNDAALKTAQAEKQQAFDDKKAAHDTAEKALSAAREAFDFVAAFTAATKDKKGFGLKPFTGEGLLNQEQLKDLGELGKWDKPWLATGKQHKGELGDMVSRTDKAAVIFRIDDVVVRPMKKWDDLKKTLTDAYWLEKANEQGKAKKTAMEDALLRLAKTKIPDKVAEIEGKRQAEVDRQFAEWEKATNAELQTAEATLAPLKAGTKAAEAWAQRRDELKQALEKKDDKKKALDAEVGKKLEADIKVEAKKKYGEVLEAAAAEAGFTVVKIGPYARDISDVSKFPRFNKRFDEDTRFAFGLPDIKKIKAGEATDVLDDNTNRMVHVVVCDVVEPRVAADLTRREFVALRDRFPVTRTQAVLSQSFGFKAVKDRYNYVVPGK